jgi:hypothetical protein
MLLTDRSGSWTAAKVPLPADAASDPNASLTSVSCLPAGDCTAIGDYTDSANQQQGVLLTEISGSWTAMKAPLPADAASYPGVYIDSVSCASVGNCTAIGFYTDSADGQQGLLLTQTSGSWTAVKAPLPADAAANSGPALYSVSCASAGNCNAIGYYADSAGGAQGLLLTQTSGSWTAMKAPLPAGSTTVRGLGSVSCPSAGDCAVAGMYTDTNNEQQGMLLTDRSGSWTAVKAPAPAGATPDYGIPSSVSCASAGDCVAVGYGAGSLEDTSLGLLWKLGPS